MKLRVKPNDGTGFWEIHYESGFLCQLESESTAALMVHAVNVQPDLVAALEDARETIKALDDDFDLRPSYLRAGVALRGRE